LNYLLVDDDAAFSAVLARVLQRRGEQAFTARNGNEAIVQLQNKKIDRVVLDLKLEQESGLAILQQLLTQQPALEIVILTGYSSISTAVEAIKLGATNYLCKPAGWKRLLPPLKSDRRCSRGAPGGLTPLSQSTGMGAYSKSLESP